MLAAMWPFDPRGLPDAFVSYQALLFAPVALVGGVLLGYPLVARRRHADTPATAKDITTGLAVSLGFAIAAWFAIAWTIRPSQEHLAELAARNAKEADSRFVDALCAGSLERARALSGRADLSVEANAMEAANCVTRDGGPYGKPVHADPRRLAVLIDSLYPEDGTRRLPTREKVERNLVAALRADRNQPGLDALRQRGVDVDVSQQPEDDANAALR